MAKKTVKQTDTSFSRNYLYAVLALFAVMLIVLFGSKMKVNMSGKAAVQTKYWVSFGPKGIPGTQWNTAETLLTQLAAKGYKPIEINRWVNGGWDAHVKGLPFNDYPLEAGKGYVVAFSAWPAGIIDTSLKFERLNSISFTLAQGWNFISIPQGLARNVQTAEELCTAVDAQQGQLAEVQKIQYDFQTVAYACGSKIGNFRIFSGTGYLLRADADGTWNIE